MIVGTVTAPAQAQPSYRVMCPTLQEEIWLRAYNIHGEAPPMPTSQ